MGNERPTLYVGVSNNIIRRVLEHKQGKVAGFTKKYGLTDLLYYEFVPDMREAIYREKELKRLLRSEKLELIQSKNPRMTDVSSELFSLVDDVSAVDVFESWVWILPAEDDAAGGVFIGLFFCPQKLSAVILGSENLGKIRN